MNHTKGPWEVDEVAEDNAGQLTLGITSDNRPGYICGIHCAAGVDLDVIDKANARLIAAAPDLREALEGTIRFWERTKGVYFQQEKMEDHIWKMRQALAKATGTHQRKE